MAFIEERTAGPKRHSKMASIEERTAGPKRHSKMASIRTKQPGQKGTQNMIYTVTLNPSLDYIVSVDNMQVGTLNRTKKELIYPGGKGINVSLVLKNLGIESCALGFLAGFTGDEILRRLWEQGIVSDFIRLQKGNSRINMKIRSESETEVNGMGPEISEEEKALLMEKIGSLTKDDVLVLAGAIPSSLPTDIYADILKKLLEKKVPVVVDATGGLLRNTLCYHPFLIKPNHHELGDLFGVKINTREEAILYAGKLQEEGARNVLVSLAGEGAVLVAETGEIFESPAPKGKVVNSVGAGDSMVAGFLAGLYGEKGFGALGRVSDLTDGFGAPGRASDLTDGFGAPGADSDSKVGLPYRNAFFTGLLAGSASAFSEGMATREAVEQLKQQMIRE